jgi:hypothetical protein
MSKVLDPRLLNRVKPWFTRGQTSCASKTLFASIVVAFFSQIAHAQRDCGLPSLGADQWPVAALGLESASLCSCRIHDHPLRQPSVGAMDECTRYRDLNRWRVSANDS